MSQFVIIADDLTGAADTGACFASAGLATVIPFADSPLPAADVIALSTETRDLAAADAARIVSQAIRNLTTDTSPDARDEGSSKPLSLTHLDTGRGRVPGERAVRVSPTPRWIYKKLDSALRGHPRDELLAAMAAIGATRALVAPAFPAEGRTTVGGVQHVDGVPLDSSRFGGAGAVSDLVNLFQNDQRVPVLVLDLATIRGQPEATRRLLAEASPGIVIADAESDDDLTALARATSESGLRMLSGTAGFARALARALPLRADAPLSCASMPNVQPVLVVAGSQHQATARQIVVLREAGLPIVAPAQEVIDDPGVTVDGIVAEVAAHLAAGRATVLTTVGLMPSPQGGHAVAARLAEIVAALEVQRLIGGLVLTGGDVAAAVCAALEASALWLGGEISPGQPWGLLVRRDAPSIAIATKAGSFGDDHALLACIEYLIRNAVQN